MPTIASEEEKNKTCIRSTQRQGERDEIAFYHVRHTRAAVRSSATELSPGHVAPPSSPQPPPAPAKLEAQPFLLLLLRGGRGTGGFGGHRACTRRKP